MDAIYQKRQFLPQRQSLNLHAVRFHYRLCSIFQPPTGLGRRMAAAHHTGMNIYIKAGSSGEYQIFRKVTPDVCPNTWKQVNESDFDESTLLGISMQCC